MNLFSNQSQEGAMISPDKKHRFVLWRIWDNDLPKVMFIGLNPSTATDIKDDPTIRRLKQFVSAWGYGGFYMLNLFTYISAFPAALETAEDPIKLADWYLQIYGKKAEEVVFMWGSFPQAKPRAELIIKQFPEAMAFSINADGSPSHPLYLSKRTRIGKYRLMKHTKP